MRVVDGNDDGAGRRLRSLAQKVGDQLPQRNDRVGVVVQISELLVEGGGGDGHAVGDQRTEAMVDEDRDAQGFIRVNPVSPQQEQDNDGHDAEEAKPSKT
jgi:hypothetical protein